MDRQTALVINALTIEHPKSSDALKLLPKTWQEILQINQVEQIKPYQPFSLLSFLDDIHYSWLTDCITHLPRILNQYFISCLNLKQREGLIKILQLSDNLPILSLGLQTYFKNILIKSLKLEKHIPVNFLPKTSLDDLLFINKADLVVIIQKLGLHDLAKELLVVVDKNKINQVSQLLTQDEATYLQMSLRQPLEAASEKSQILNFINDPIQFSRRIQECGLKRLGLALSQQDQEWLWNFTRRLDKGRGQQVEKWASSKNHPLATRALNQVMALISKKLKNEADQ